MFEFLKIVHYLAFAVGIGGGLANGLAGALMRNGPPESAPALGTLQRRVGRASFVGLLLLWVTGPWMVLQRYDGFQAMGTWFWLKILAVLALTVAAIYMQKLGLDAKRSQRPPDPRMMARLGAASGISATLAVIFAVLAFT